MKCSLPGSDTQMKSDEQSAEDFPHYDSDSIREMILRTEESLKATESSGSTEFAVRFQIAAYYRNLEWLRSKLTEAEEWESQQYESISANE